MSQEREANSSSLSHVASDGGARMVDVSAKPTTRRSARAEAWVSLRADVARLLERAGAVTKGEVLETARVAGIMAAKRTSELIPMCHPLVLDSIQVTAEVIGDRVRLEARVQSEGKTGVEMEALTAAAIAALTVYDMIKSADKTAEIGPVRLLEKSGGKSGYWRRGDESQGNGGSDLRE